MSEGEGASERVMGARECLKGRGGVSEGEGARECLRGRGEREGEREGEGSVRGIREGQFLHPYSL